MEDRQDDLGGPGLDDLVCFEVYALSHAFTEIYRPILAPLGLTYPQYLAMRILWRGGGGTVGEIGRALGLTSSTLTPLLKRLEAAGLVQRRRDPEDERRVLVDLTETGRAMAPEADRIRACVSAATGFDEDRLMRLQRELRATRRALQGRDAEPD